MATQEKESMQFLSSISQYAVFVQAVYLSIIIIANHAICQRLSHNFWHVRRFDKQPVCCAYLDFCNLVCAEQKG